MSSNRRMERVSDLLREVASEVIRMVKDPQVADALITITRVDVTPDLSNARFQISVLAEDDQQKRVLEGLNRASGFIRHEIKQRVHLKRIPAVSFEIDQALVYGNRMNRLFEQVRATTGAAVALGDGEEAPSQD